MKSLLLLSLLVTLLSAPAPGQVGEDSRRATPAAHRRLAEEVHRAGGYVDRLPTGLTDLDRSGGSGGGRAADPDPLPRPPARVRSATTRSIPWAPILALVCGLLLVLVIMGRGRRVSVTPTPSPKKEDGPVGGQWQRQAPEQLASRQDWAEAIAALLYRALRLTGWEPIGRQASLTAREVLATVSPGDARRPHLQQVLSLAERVRFGGSTATEELFGRVREAFVLAGGGGDHGE